MQRQGRQHLESCNKVLGGNDVPVSRGNHDYSWSIPQIGCLLHVARLDHCNKLAYLHSSSTTGSF